MLLFPSFSYYTLYFQEGKHKYIFYEVMKKMFEASVV